LSCARSKRNATPVRSGNLRVGGASGPAFKLQKPPPMRVPRPSRTLRRAGTATASTTVVWNGQKLRRQHRRPPLKKRKDGAPSVQWQGRATRHRSGLAGTPRPRQHASLPEAEPQSGSGKGGSDLGDRLTRAVSCRSDVRKASSNSEFAETSSLFSVTLNSCRTWHSRSCCAGR